MSERLDAFRCDCGFGSVLERVYCPRCRGEFHRSSTSPDGSVLSWTILRTTGDGFEAPLGLAIVGLESGINTMARFDPARPVAVGERVRVRTGADGLRWLTLIG